MKASKFLRLKAKKEQATKVQPVVQAPPVVAPVVAPVSIVEPVVEEVKEEVVEKVEAPVTKPSLASKAIKKKTDEQLTE